VLVEAAEKIPTCGAISPMIMTGDGKNVWFSGGKIDWFSMRASHSSPTTRASLYQTEYLSGCALLIKKKVFEKIGLLDERFFLYYEDVDFSFRTKRAGFSLFVLPQEKVFHQEQSNNENPKKLYWLVLSALIFFKEHGTIIHKIWYFFFMPIRKIKNFLNLKFSKDANTVFVKQAYKDFKKISRN
jgi:GT2 family glycosyltransferase